MRRILATLVLAATATGCTSTKPLAPFSPQADAVVGANLVIVQTAGSPDEAYRAAMRNLVEQGFTLASSSDAARVASTNWSGPALTKGRTWTLQNNPEMMVSFSVSEAPATIRYRGEVRVGILSSVQTERIEKVANANSSWGAAFAVLDSLAHAHVGGRVLYARE